MKRAYERNKKVEKKPDSAGIICRGLSQLKYEVKE